jgi:pimeloyl-ACP methyl ester carboxylesterase
VIDAVCERPLLLVGSSLGGWIALLVALERRERVRGLVAVAPAPDFTEDLLLARLSEDERAAFDRTGRLEVPSAYDPEPTVFTWQLITEARQHLLMRRPIPLRMPVHLLHGQADPDVPWQISLDLAARLDSADVTVELIKDGEHRLSRPEDLERLDAAVLRLARRLRGPRAFPFA